MMKTEMSNCDSKKIEISQAFDNIVLEQRMMDEINDLASEPDEYEQKDLESAQKRFGKFNLVQLTDWLMQHYENNFADQLDEIKPPLSFYVAVDYASLLRDEHYTGYIDIIRLPEKKTQTQYLLFATPEGLQNSKLFN